MTLVCYADVTWSEMMARGVSGRVVMEIEGDLKDRLYRRLQQEERTLKEWFVEQAEAYLRRNPPGQLDLFPRANRGGYAR